MPPSATDDQSNDGDDGKDAEMETAIRALSVVAGVAINHNIAISLRAKRDNIFLTTLTLMRYSGKVLARGNFQRGLLDKITLPGYILWTVPMVGELFLGNANEIQWILGGLTLFSCRYSQTRVIWIPAVTATVGDERVFCIAYGDDGQRVIVTAALVGDAWLWNKFVHCIKTSYSEARSYAYAMQLGSYLLYRLCTDTVGCAYARICSVSFRMAHVQGMIDQLFLDATTRGACVLAREQDRKYDFKCCIARAIGIPPPDMEPIYSYDVSGSISYHEWNVANRE